MQAGLASLKRNCNAKENFKQGRTCREPPEQKPEVHQAQEHHGESTKPEADFNSILSGIGQINSKTFTMPNNAQFAQKWRSFQNTLQQLTLAWVDILQECTKNDGVCAEPTKNKTEKTGQDTKKISKKQQPATTKSRNHKRREITITTHKAQRTEITTMTTSLKEGFKRIRRTYADATIGAPGTAEIVTASPECTLDIPREQNGPALRNQLETNGDVEESTLDDQEWTKVTKKSRRNPVTPPGKKPEATHSDCTLDTTREHDEPAMEEIQIHEATVQTEEQIQKAKEEWERQAKKPNGRYLGGSLFNRTPYDYHIDMRRQARREAFLAQPDHRSLLFRAHVARQHPDRLMRQISSVPPNESHLSTRSSLRKEFRDEILATMDEEPAEWRSMVSIQFCLMDVLQGKPVFPKRALDRPCRGYREADEHVTEILRCISANPSLMATPWGESLYEPKSIETKREYDMRLAILRRMPLPLRRPKPQDEPPKPPTEEELEQARLNKMFPTFTEAQQAEASSEDEYRSENDKDPSEVYGPEPESPIDFQEYADDYMGDYDAYYTDNPVEPATETEPDTVVMIPIGNDYIDNHPDPTLVQIQYILTMLISRKERFGMIKGIAGGSQARKITNSHAANKKANQRKTSRQKTRQKQQNFQVWLDGISKPSAMIQPTTTAQSLIEELFPVEPRPDVTLRCKGQTWQPKATAANKGITAGDTIRVLSRGLGGMKMVESDDEDEEDEAQLLYEELQRKSPNRVIRPSEFFVPDHKRQRRLRQQGTLDAFVTPPSNSPNTPTITNVTRMGGRTTEVSMPAPITVENEDHTPTSPNEGRIDEAGGTDQSEQDSTQLDEEPPTQRTAPENSAKEIQDKYRKDPFTRTFLFKKFSAMSLNAAQLEEITALKVAQVQQIVDLCIPARTIQVGPLRMTQIPDVVNAIHQMGYPINVSTVLQQMTTNRLQQYVHNFDTRKPDRCMLTIELTKEVEFGTIPSTTPLVLQIWRQFTMIVGAGAEKSYIKIQPCHPPGALTYPLCTLYDIHTGNMQLDMMQHCYFVMKQCLLEHQYKKQLYIEFRMGSVANPQYTAKDKRSRPRITTTYGIVHISKPATAAMTNMVEWMNTLQQRVQHRMQRKSVNTRHFILQGPYTIGVTFGRYQDLPPAFHTVSGSLTSDPLICLLHVPPTFHDRIGDALDNLGEMLSSNLILSIHIRDDWVREEGVHAPRLSVAFTLTGPPITEAVRSMVQSAIRLTLGNPQATVMLPSATSHPTPWNRVEELTPKSPAGTTDHTDSALRSDRPLTASSRTAWSAVPRTSNPGPLVTQTFDITGIQGLPETLVRLNDRMSEIEANAGQARREAEVNQARQDAQFGNVFALLTTMAKSVQSLVEASTRDQTP